LAAAGYLLVLHCELTLGYTASEAGAVLIPASVIFLALSPVSGALVPRIGPRRLMTAGILAVGVGLLWWAFAPAGSYAGSILPGTVLWGLGLGLVVTPLTAAVLAAVSDLDLGEASAISDVAARLGGALMIALVPALVGVQAGRGLAEALAQGYRRRCSSWPDSAPWLRRSRRSSSATGTAPPRPASPRRRLSTGAPCLTPGPPTALSPRPG